MPTAVTVAVECTHCGVHMTSHTGGGGTVRYFHCASCRRWSTSVYSEVFRADTKMRPTSPEEAKKPFGNVRERLERWLQSLSDQSPYAVLGATPVESDDSIRERYRRLAKQHHPDSGGDVNQMRRINEAYDSIRRQRSVRVGVPALVAGT